VVPPPLLLWGIRVGGRDLPQSKGVIILPP